MGVKVREKIKGSGEWWLIIHRDGRKVTKRIGNKKAAEQAKKIVEGHLAAGRTALPERKQQVPMLEGYYRGFKETYLEMGVRPNTKDMYANSFNRILPVLGTKTLDQITREDVTALIAGMVKNGFAKTTIRITMSHLTCLFNNAIEDELITKNPTKNTSKFYKQAPDRHAEIQPLTAPEVQLFFRAVLKHSPEHYPLFLAAIHTGLRLGELAALQWGDIDFNGKFLVVRRSYSHGKLANTKVDKIHRVDLSKDLMNTLHDLKRQRREQWLKKGNNEIPEWVFCNEVGGLPDVQNLKNRHFDKCLEKAGLRRIRFHDLRHTFASLLLQNGESLVYVKDQLGHSSIKMTVDTYGHLVPGANRAAMDRLPTVEESLDETSFRADKLSK